MVWRGAVVLCVLLASGSPVFAQSTGGSFGGGSFSGGSSSSSSGGSGSSSGSSHDWSSSSSGGTGECGEGGAIVVVLVVGVILALVFSQMLGSTQTGTSSGESLASGEVDVTAVSLAIDWRARREVQQALERLAKTGDTKTPAGRATLVRETSVVLRRVEHAWLYASVTNASPSSSMRAEELFRRVASEMRSRYQREVVRSVDGQTTEEPAPAIAPRPEEGTGVVVVTLLAAARKRALSDVANAGDASAIRDLLKEIGSLVEWQLVALEVIWSPAAEEDRMSTAELEQLYPEMKKVDEASVAGRVFCDYCRGPYPAELLKCPHCGAVPTAPSAGSA